MIRKNIYSLTSTEWERVVNAFNAVKSAGVYDAFTERHVRAMQDMTLWGTETSTSRNVAHAGPSFLPWHRQSIREFELELQRIEVTDDGCTPTTEPLMLPYWRWDQDTSGWPTARIWSMVGGNGDPNQGNRVVDGPFSHWNSLIQTSTGGLVERQGIIRIFNTSGTMYNAGSMTIANYDVEPWSTASSSRDSFRRDKEGRHNTVHNLIGGDMATGASTNDPIFWFHHANVDRIWATYQGSTSMTRYAPESGGPDGHNLNDILRHLLATDVTPARVLDWRTMDYTYDTLG